MPSLRNSALPVCIAALVTAVLSSGCAAGRLSPQAPPGVHLTGDWRLDPARSDDLGKALSQLRAQEKKQARDRHSRQMGGEGAEGGAGHMRGRQTQNGQNGQTPGEQMGMGPGPHVSATNELMSNVPQGDYLRITTSPGSLTVTAGNSSDQYTPGLPTEISAQLGDAQQTSGWKGADFVIDTQPQLGPEIIQSYGLTKDGTLKMTVRLTGEGTNFLFTRIYDRTRSVSPLAPPTND